MTRPYLLATAALVPVLCGCDRLLALSVDASFIDHATLTRELDRAAVAVIDVRPPQDYERGHIRGAVSVPFVELNGHLLRARGARGQRLVLVAATSTDAILAAPTARLHGNRAVRALGGGMAGWRALGLPVVRGPSPPRADGATPRLELTRRQQIVAFLSGGVIKPAYMILSLALVLWLRRARAAPLRLLWHGLLWFLVGEAFCAVNYYMHTPGRMYVIDLLHGAGMVAMSTLVPWGLFRLLDERVLHFGDPAERCTVQRLCGRCWKREPVACAPHDLMIMLVLALAVVALMPLSADLRPTLFQTVVFDSSADYGAPIVNHIVELRAYPVIGAAVMLLCVPLLRGGPASVRRAEPFFFVGFGFLAYPLLRHLLVNTYRDALWWSDFWEELTELIMILAVGMLLFLLRRQLGITRRRERAADSPAP